MLSDVRKQLADVLAGTAHNLGWQVDTVASGTAALEELARARAAGERPYDVALVDWRMPGMDGVEAGRRITASA